MSYYENQASWSAPNRQPSWEQPAPPSRSGTSSVGAREEVNCFTYQFAEVERAIDNLVKSGKMPFGFSGAPSTAISRHPSVTEFDAMRPQSGGNLQSYYQNQRFGPRPGDQDQMMQAKRRMAAQRERELRNYHQEQQYQKHSTGPKSDRSMSPNTAMSEDERRELIARQHRALYGNDSSLYPEQTSRPVSQDARVAPTLGVRGNSPLAYDPFGLQGQSNTGEPAVQMPPRGGEQQQQQNGQFSGPNSTTSPISNPTANFSHLENAQQPSRTSNSSPGGSPPRDGAQKGQTGSANPAPIGTRPAGNQQSGPQGQNNLQKRSTTPLPSPLSYGFSANDQQHNERSTSASSNPSSSAAEKGVPAGLGWGSNSGVWGSSKNSLGVQASVWG
ncbi:hypothetical protein FKW77_006909 [Venturia effusa]|uniref:Uncharacterized protein n=1 Tax=Venturia effusa TaxID=50376 RepID=A0A517LHH4_9PEZI|nr:hypothetical protein FKW77_006909 [Venturia effusa]